MTSGDASGPPKAYREAAGRYFDSFVVIDANAVILDVVGLEWLGLHRDDLVGTNGFALIHSDDLELAAAALRLELSGATHAARVTVRVRRADGDFHRVDIIGTDERDTPEIGGLLLMVHDAGGRPLIDRSLAVAEYLFRELATTATDFIVLLDGDLAPVHVSPSITPVLGWDVSDLEQLRGTSLLHRDDVERVWGEIRHVAAQPDAVRRVDGRLVRPDGSYVWMDITIGNRLKDLSINAIVVHYRNIDERRRAADRLFHLALHDPLTGLPNRQHFADHLDALTEEPGVVSITVLFCDLVDFKAVNDRLGHAAGDLMLQQVAARLRSTVRPHDLVARVGGDEFCVVCTDVDPSHATDLGLRIVRSFIEPIDLDGVPVTVGISVGVARSEGGRAVDLLRRADEAMYRAKARGSATFELYEG